MLLTKQLTMQIQYLQKPSRVTMKGKSTGVAILFLILTEVDYSMIHG